MGVGEVLRDQQEEAPESVEGRTYREVKKFGGGGIFPYRGISPSPHTNGPWVKMQTTKFCNS